MMGPAPSDEKKSVADTEDKNGVAYKLKQLANCNSYTWYTDRFRILNQFLILPSLVELTDQTGLVHKSEFSWSGETHYHNQRIDSVTLYRHRPRLGGFWNGLARFFCPNQAVLSINFNGQLWCCNYYISYYYMTAQRYRDVYYETLKEGFGGHDFVIISNE